MNKNSNKWATIILDFQAQIFNNKRPRKLELKSTAAIYLDNFNH